MRDLPAGPSLLSLARDVLLNDLLPLLPEQHRLDARLVANSMAIAEREGVFHDDAKRRILRELAALYEVAETGPELLDRFARDLRGGVFEGSMPSDRDARAILWRLTIFKLRQANPRFLAANGLS
jgi:Domain of unknown function (DUF6285)